MKYGVDITPVEARNQPASVLCGDGGEVYAPTTSLLEDLGHDRQRAVGAGADDEPTPPQGSFSSADKGVCPNSSRYGFEGFFFRSCTRPPSMTMSWTYSRPSTSMDPNRSSRTCISVTSRCVIGRRTGVARSSYPHVSTRVSTRPGCLGCSKRPRARGRGTSGPTTAGFRVRPVAGAPCRQGHPLRGRVGGLIMPIVLRRLRGEGP
jgi:hypothetical protein